MAKTKKTKTKIIVKPTPSKAAHLSSACLLCWLFKIMIALFIAMIIFWLGFCFGALSAWPVGPKVSDSNLSTGQLFYPNLPTINNATFDEEFLGQMIKNHEEAIEMAKLALEKTTDEGIKSLCREIINIQTEKINQLRAWGWGEGSAASE